MTALEQVMQLKNQGMADDQIASNLQQQGVSPNEINTALSQAQIKNAVTAEQPAPAGQEQYAPAQEPLTQEAPAQDPYAQAPAQEQYAQPEQGAAPGQEEYYPQEGYDQGYAPQAAGGFDSNTIMEIAEQVFAEKTKKIEKQLSEFNEFKTLTQTKVENIDNRVKKMETMIDKLQITILEKVGSYGSNIEGIKKEMGMMQDSFGKMINKVADKTSTQIPTQSNAPIKKVAKKISK